MEAFGVNKRDAMNQIRQFGSKFDRLRNAAGGVAQAIELAAELANLVHCVALIHPECLHADGRR
ncbi:hypothetical protein LOCUS_55250 [Klebsiella pneumoniae]|nr:hypothetical protein LOCUS_55250 [Klebsiella pneumoniae]